MADVFDEETETEPSFTMKEYLDEIEEQELEADLVLGGDEGKECTYSKGYMKRQAIFSCLTCAPDGNAGLCTACSLSCHDGHEIVELWTKRNFRCDCGNSKFGEFFCKLLASKDVENGKNSYNHNFKGAYCTCGRPYPDPDAATEEEMIQCCICEDWFHDSHLGLDSPEQVPRDDEGNLLYEDLICQACSAACSFLTLYPCTMFVSAKRQDAAATSKKQKGAMEEVQSDAASTATLDNGAGSSEHVITSDAVPSPVNEYFPSEKGVVSVETSEKKLGLNKCIHLGSSSSCTVGLDLRVAAPTLESNKSMFLAKGWRASLCQCEACVAFYNQKDLGFLLDKDDSVAEYEKVAKTKRQEKLQEQEGNELNFLNKLGHVEKIEVLSGIADMKNELQSFLASHDTSKPITAADIHGVFDNIKKRRRL